MGKLAVFPGTFDPITVGHADIVRRGADLFGEVLVLVCRNSEKKTFFDAKQRLELARAAFAEDVRVRVELCEKTVSDAAAEYGADCILKGVRDTTDYAYEARICGAMRALGGPETVLFCVNREYADVSSTFVRELLHYGKDYTPYVPQGAIALLERFLSEK